MTPTRRVVRTLLAAALLATPIAAVAQEDVRLTGTWSVAVTSPDGVFPAALALTEEGDRLTGIVVGERGPAPVEGTRAADGVTLRFSITYEGAPLHIVMSAPAARDELSGRVDFGGVAEGTWTARRDAPAGVSGAWAFTADDGGMPVPAQLMLVEDGGRVNGRLLARSHGIDGLVRGTVTDGVLQLAVDATVNGSPLVIDLPGRLTGETLAGTYAAGDRAGRWTAVRP